MRLFTKAALAVAIVVGTTVAEAIPAPAADKAVVTVEKGTVTDFVLNKGEACDFALQFHGEADITTIKRKRGTTTIYSKATARVTNPGNGRSKTFNANSTFVDRDRSDGTQASSSRGNSLFFGPVGFDSDPGPAFLYVRGTTKGTTLNPSSDDPPLVFSTIKGRVTNVCALLG
jgi:hypothetical protein